MSDRTCTVCGDEFAPNDSDFATYCSKECFDVAGEGYNRSAEEIVERTLGAFRQACRDVGASGFQASWALMQVLWKGNAWDGPGVVIRAEDMVYPQYDLPSEKARQFEEREETRQWIGEKAIALLTEHGLWRDGTFIEDADPELVSLTVVEHWKQLAEEVTDGR